MNTHLGPFHLGLAAVLTSWIHSSPAAPPDIRFAPRNQAVVLHQQAALGVIVSGTAPLSYQWKRNGMALVGETNDALLLARAKFSDAGLYSVQVTNGEGMVTSGAVELTVSLPRAGDVDGSFVPSGNSNIVDSTIQAIAMQPDGKVLLAGFFSTVHGAARSGIARLNANGTIDHTFMNGLSGALSASGYSSARAVAIQTDGKIIVGGQFVAVNGTFRPWIARLHPDGTLDDGFRADDVYDSVNAVVAQTDGKVLVGTAAGLTRLNSDGTWHSEGDVSESVYAIVEQGDGKILVGGQGGLARLNADGSIDTSFQKGLSGISGTVSAIALEAAGRILVGGSWTYVNGAFRPDIARLNADGTLDAGFQPAITGGSRHPYSLALQGDGRVIVAGWFTAVDGVSRPGIARLNIDGSLDNDYLDELGGVAGGAIYTLGTQTDGKVLVGAAFDLVNGTSLNGITRLQPDGSLDTSFQNSAGGPSSLVSSVVAQRDGKVVIGGRNGIARLNADGQSDHDFQGLFGLRYWVESVGLQGDGKILIGGSFTPANDTHHYGILRLQANGTLDDDFQKLPFLENTRVESVAVQSNQKILIGGFIGLARLNAGGAPDIKFLGSVDDSVFSVAVQADGKVLVGGVFAQISGTNCRALARLKKDGTFDDSFRPNLGGGFASVESIALQTDGKILIGGWFQTVNGVGRTNIARLDPDGSADPGFLNGLRGPDGTVKTVAIATDGRILIGGDFRTVNGVRRQRIAQLNANGTLDTSFLDEAAGANDSVCSIAVQNDGMVLVGGSFSVVNGVPVPGVARLWGTAPSCIESVSQLNLGGVILTLHLPPGTTNQVQYKTNWNDTTWTDLPGDIISGSTNGLTYKVDETAGPASQRYYRLRRLP